MGARAKQIMKSVVRTTNVVVTRALTTDAAHIITARVQALHIRDRPVMTVEMIVRAPNVFRQEQQVTEVVQIAAHIVPLMEYAQTHGVILVSVKKGVLLIVVRDIPFAFHIAKQSCPKCAHMDVPHPQPVDHVIPPLLENA